MSLILNGTDGLSDVDGTAATPAIRGTDANTGIFFPAADTIAFSEGGAEVARFDSSGQLNIGSTTQNGTTSKLYVRQATDGGFKGLSVISSASQQYVGSFSIISGGILDINQSYLDGSGSYQPISFTTSGSERMRISATGNVGIGNSSPPYPLSVASSTADLTVYVQNTKGDASGDIVQVAVTRNTTNGTTRPYTYYNTGGGAYRFYVLDSGNCQNTNGSYGAFSDVKLKENIVDATPKLEDLCKVKVRNYNLKADQTHKQIGVIAQELEEVFAGLVEEIDDRDGDGNDLGTTTKTVKYSVFIPMLIKAIQELNAKVEAQAVRIAELEGAR
jgi:hypothetical protein